VPCILRWPAHVPADSVQNGIFSGMDWFPTFVAAAGNSVLTGQSERSVRRGARFS
jgi:arylsulfatase